MAEEHTVLALLVDKGPACAAELEHWLFETVGFLGSTKHMVDRSLVKLCADGFIEGTGEVRGPTWGPLPRRAVYGPTAEGEAEVTRWRADPSIEGYMEAILRDLDWLQNIQGPDDLPLVIATARQRAAQARRDLADHSPVPDDRLLDLERPLHEVMRDLYFNGEIGRLNAEIASMTRIEQMARDMLAGVDPR